MSWEHWLSVNDWSSDNSGIESMHDKLLELAIDSYDIRSKSRKMERIDVKHFLVLWWIKNKRQFRKYRTMSALAKLLNVDHATINHYEKHRKKSRLFNDNTQCINDFLES